MRNRAVHKTRGDLAHSALTGRVWEILLPNNFVPHTKQGGLLSSTLDTYLKSSCECDMYLSATGNSCIHQLLLRSTLVYLILFSILDMYVIVYWRCNFCLISQYFNTRPATCRNLQIQIISFKQGSLPSAKDLVHRYTHPDYSSVIPSLKPAAKTSNLKTTTAPQSVFKVKSSPSSPILQTWALYT